MPGEHTHTYRYMFIHECQHSQLSRKRIAAAYTSGAAHHTPVRGQGQESAARGNSACADTLLRRHIAAELFLWQLLLCASYLTLLDTNPGREGTHSATWRGQTCTTAASPADLWRAVVSLALSLGTLLLAAGSSGAWLRVWADEGRHGRAAVVLLSGSTAGVLRLVSARGVNEATPQSLWPQDMRWLLSGLESRVQSAAQGRAGRGRD